MGTVLQQNGLQASIPTTYVDIGLKALHPVLRMQDLLAELSSMGKVGELILQGHTFSDMKHFWKLFRNHHPKHPVFQDHSQRLQYCIPMYLHCDEGTGPKKRGLLVMQYQPVVGQGSRRADDLNTAGSTYRTRMLYSVLSVHLYNKKKTFLFQLLQHWVNDLLDAYHNGVKASMDNGSVQLYPIILGLKGDWAGLAKFGRLSRNFQRDAPSSSNPPGVCHLCQAGRLGFPWHHFEADAAWLTDPHAKDDVPWHHPSPLSQLPSDVAGEFYLIDVFHTLHKGLFGDFAASSLASWIRTVLTFSICGCVC